MFLGGSPQCRAAFHLTITTKYTQVLLQPRQNMSEVACSTGSTYLPSSLTGSIASWFVAHHCEFVFMADC
jgi:hypothetical protein